MALDPARQQLQRDLEQAYQRGQLDETVRTVQSRLADINSSIRDLQQTMSILSKGTVTRQEFEALETTVRGLERWKYGLTAVVGAAIAVSQILPRLIDLWGKE